MNYLVDIMWLVIWTIAFMCSIGLAIKVMMLIAFIVGPSDVSKRVDSEDLTITEGQIFVTSVLWGAIIIFYN